MVRREEIVVVKGREADVREMLYNYDKSFY